MSTEKLHGLETIFTFTYAIEVVGLAGYSWWRKFELYFSTLWQFVEIEYEDAVNIFLRTVYLTTTSCNSERADHFMQQY
jgi:hypothetical protein